MSQRLHEEDVEKSNLKIQTDEKLGKSDQKIVMYEELVHNVAMDEELIQNGLMYGNFVRKFVIHAKIDPEVVMDLSTF